MSRPSSNGIDSHKANDQDAKEAERPKTIDLAVAAYQNFSLATEEWDNVATVVPVGGNARYSTNFKQTDLITFNEALQFFQTANLQEHSKQIKPVIERHGFSFLFHCLCGSPKLCRELHNERDLVFTIAACPLDNNEQIHMRVLQTIFKQLTGDKLDCPRYGKHWEHIGFQGIDPATDLRGVGFWGLMNLLYLLMNPQTLPLARSIYKLSLHETQNFPFLVMSINVTAIVLQALREECLNRTCNRRQQVVAVVNEHYTAVFLHLYLRWKNENKTISHSGFVLKDVEAFAKKNPRMLMKHCENYLSDPSADDQRQTNISTRTSLLPQAQPPALPTPPSSRDTQMPAPSAEFSILPDTRRPVANNVVSPPALMSNGRPNSFAAAISSNHSNHEAAEKYLYARPIASLHPVNGVVVENDDELDSETIIREGEQELFI